MPVDVMITKADLDAMEARLEAKILAVTEILTGNGSPERGFIVRVDRMERTLQRLEPEEETERISYRVRVLEAQQQTVLNVIRYIGVPITLALVMGILTLVGGVLTHSVVITFAK